MTRGKKYILQLYNTYHQTNLKHPVSCLQYESNMEIAFTLFFNAHRIRMIKFASGIRLC